MPQQEASSKKKKKGRAPAHQNTFAYKHNPKSKKTEAILNSPNIHVCRRCHEKIEWRKKYRKYKPLTQPSKCNLCLERKVKAAYHTLCTSCTTSEKAKRGLNNSCATAESNKDENNEWNEIYRVCAVCGKEPALPCSDDEANEKGHTRTENESSGRMRLRERKTLERKLAREQQENSRQNNEEESVENESVHEDSSTNDNDPENDPFLIAVGGMALTGEAYQEMMVKKHEAESQKL